MKFAEKVKKRIDWEIERRKPNVETYAYWKKHFAYWTDTFTGKYEGEDAFLLCNGPSLNDIDTEHLRNYHIIGLNKIYLLTDKRNLDLTFQVAVNRHVIEQGFDRFRETPWPTFLSHHSTSRVFRDDFKSGRFSLPKNIHLLFAERTIPAFATGLNDRFNESYTVTYVALQMAFYFGFQNVFILGMDHNFKAQGNTNELQKMENDDPNHFDPNYFKGMNWQLPDLEGSELGYRMADFYFRRSGRAIYDATEKGKCRIFPRISFDQALDQAKRK
ncbi:MAG: hypothetical protein AAGJ81_09555 [Verrucomicrobiota bacterium]